MKNYINKIHPAILATIFTIVIIGFVVLVCIYPVTFIIACILAAFGMAWVTIYEAILSARRFS